MGPACVIIQWDIIHVIQWDIIHVIQWDQRVRSRSIHPQTGLHLHDF